jgi:hypothetical protein
MREKVDIVSVIMIILGFIMINSNNNLGWLFIAIGILKWVLEK